MQRINRYRQASEEKRSTESNFLAGSPMRNQVVPANFSNEGSSEVPEAESVKPLFPPRKPPLIMGN
jgi:hypothetical protein